MKNRAICVLGVLLWAGPLPAADFCVNTAAGLALALDVADNNNQSDTIRLAQNTYVGNFNYDANAAEVGNLVVEGGYDAACLSRTIDPANTVLQGNGGRTLRLNGRDNSTLAVSGLTVRDGQSQLGGAGLDIGRWTEVSVSRNIFTQNHTVTGFDGSGGLNIDRSGIVEVTANQFIANAGGKGGGLSLSDPVLARVDANLFLDNQAEQNSGAIDGDSAGRFVIRNNIVARNSAAEDGAGISLKLFVDGSAGSADLTNNTITANTAGQQGGGIDLKMIGDDTSAVMYNNIVFGNSAGQLGRDLFLDNDDEQNGIASAVAMFNNNLDQSGLGMFRTIPFLLDPSNFNNVNPLFVDVAADDYSLQATSLMIDAGSAAAPELPAFDYNEAARLSGLAPDIGALEFIDTDADGDSVSDDNDNCTLVANPDQIDTDADGYGNRCDADLNNDGIINFGDLMEMRSAFFSNPASPTWNPHADFNGDDLINFLDLVLMRATFFGAPGPSGLVP